MKDKFITKPAYHLYKPLTKEGAGAAYQFTYDDSKKSIFVEAARQAGAKLEIGHKDQFDWLNKIVFKLGVTDLGLLLLMFSGKNQEAKCIHQPPGGSHTSVLEIKKQTGTYDNYQVKLSRTTKVDDKKETQLVGIYLDHHEAVILVHFLRESLTRMLGFKTNVIQKKTEE